MTDLLGGFRKTKGIKIIQIKTMTFTNEFDDDYDKYDFYNW